MITIAQPSTVHVACMPDLREGLPLVPPQMRSSCSLGSSGVGTQEWNGPDTIGLISAWDASAVYTGDTGALDAAVAAKLKGNSSSSDVTHVSSVTTQSSRKQEGLATRRSFVAASMPRFLRTYLREVEETERHMYEVSMTRLVCGVECLQPVRLPTVCLH
jgi:hypothetical protein